MKLDSLLDFVRSRDFIEETDLCKIMKKNGSDKCSDWHNYTPVYSKLFDHLKEEKLNFFELGIFFGASVRSWCEYFPQSNIFAGDVDQEFFINDDRVKSYFCDQDSTDSIRQLWQNFESQEMFDIIIEDGKHEFSSNYNFLVNSLHMLKKGGIFIVEDLTLETYQNFARVINPVKEHFDLEEIVLLEIPYDKNSIDNRLLIIRK